MGHGKYGIKVGLNLTKSMVDMERHRARAKTWSNKGYLVYAQVASSRRIRFKRFKALEVQSVLSPFVTFWASIFFLM